MFLLDREEDPEEQGNSEHLRMEVEERDIRERRMDKESERDDERKPCAPELELRKLVERDDTGSERDRLEEQEELAPELMGLF